MQKNVIDKMIKCVMSVYCVMWHNKKKIYRKVIVLNSLGIKLWSHTVFLLILLLQYILGNFKGTILLLTIRFIYKIINFLMIIFNIGRFLTYSN